MSSLTELANGVENKNYFLPVCFLWSRIEKNILLYFLLARGVGLAMYAILLGKAENSQCKEG